jgi:PAS domain S-box-containing protein
MPSNTEMTDIAWSSQLAEFVWDNCRIGQAFVNLRGNWLKVNPALCTLIGYTEDELAARTWMEVTDPQDTSADLAAVGKVISGESNSYTMIKRYIRKFGGTVTVELTVVPWKTVDGDRIAFFYSQVIPQSPAPTPIQLHTEDTDTLAAIRFARKHWRWIIVFLMFVAGSGAIRNVIELAAKLGLVQ